jgi:Skp family chaperone for outer membrane proteins
MIEKTFLQQMMSGFIPTLMIVGVNVLTHKSTQAESKEMKTELQNLKREFQNLKSMLKTDMEKLKADFYSRLVDDKLKTRCSTNQRQVGTGYFQAMSF